MNSIKIGRGVSVVFMVSVPLLIAIVILFSNTAIAQTISYEKGDLLFRKLNWPGLGNFGHTAIYWKWDGLHDPSDGNNHFIIESLANGPQISLLDSFYSASAYLGDGSKNPTYAQRNGLVGYAKAQADAGKPYTLAWEHTTKFKGPDAYRCDGLAEAAYESVGLDIVPTAEDYGDTTYPTNQASHMASYPGIAPNVEITSITCPSDPYPTDQYYRGTITITAHANDGTHGSGTKLVQFWDGVPPISWSSTPNIGKDLHDADIEDDYTYDWDTTTGADGQYTLYAKVYDQAGNSKVSSGETMTVDNTPPTAAFTHSVSDFTVNFYASGSTDETSGIDRYEWDFGDGGTGSGVSPSHTYSDAGTYTVTLKVWDKAGNDGTGTRWGHWKWSKPITYLSRCRHLHCNT
jgi:hypothetical protein